MLVKNRERIEVPGMFWPLAAYAVATLVASVFSVDPSVSLVDSKQLVLLVIVPLAYRLFRGRRALLAVDVIITVGALSATFGHHPVPDPQLSTTSGAGRRARSGCT